MTIRRQRGDGDSDGNGNGNGNGRRSRIRSALRRTARLPPKRQAAQPSPEHRLAALRWRAPPGTDGESRTGTRAGARPGGVAPVPAEPPAPPLQPTPAMACDPMTPRDVLWRIARDEPGLRRWIVANPAADAALLEFVSQAGGPYVRESLQILFDSMEGRPPRGQERISSTAA